MTILFVELSSWNMNFRIFYFDMIFFFLIISQDFPFFFSSINLQVSIILSLMKSLFKNALCIYRA